MLYPLHERLPLPPTTHRLVTHRSYLGFPTLGIQWRRTESPALRRYTGMAPEQTGKALAGEGNRVGWLGWG